MGKKKKIKFIPVEERVLKSKKTEGTNMDTFLKNLPRSKSRSNNSESESSGTQGSSKSLKRNADKKGKAFENVKDKENIELQSQIKVKATIYPKNEHSPETCAGDTTVQTPIKTRLESPFGDGKPQLENPISGERDNIVTQEGSNRDSKGPGKNAGSQPGDEDFSLFECIKNMEQTDLETPQGVKQAPPQLQRVGTQPQGPHETLLNTVSPVQTLMPQHMVNSTRLQGQPLQQTRLAPLIYYQNGINPQTPAGYFNHNGGQRPSAVQNLGMPGPQPGIQMVPHSSILSPYQQSNHFMNNQMQSYQFQASLQGYRSHPNPFPPSYQPIYVTQNFYGYPGGQAAQHTGYFQAPQGPQNNSNWSGAETVNSGASLVGNPLPGTPVGSNFQESIVQKPPQEPLQPPQLMSLHLDKPADVQVSCKKRRSRQPEAPRFVELQTLKKLNEGEKGGVQDVLKSLEKTLDSNTAKNRVILADSELKCSISDKVEHVMKNINSRNFDRSVGYIKTLEIDSLEGLMDLVNLVYDKAINEPLCSEAYALMCKELAMMQVSSGPDSKAAKEESGVNFRKLIINRCQQEFEKNTVDENARAVKMTEIEACPDPEKKKELQFALNEEERKIRIESVGNIRFIGELFKAGMLTTNILHRCILHLLTQVDEDSLERLCNLVSTIGKDMESKNQNLDPYFKQMQDIVNRKIPDKIGSRVRFMLQDVIDLRLNKWIPRRADNNPKTMDAIAKEAETECLDTHLNNTSRNTSRRDNRNRRRNRNSGEAIEGVGWTAPINSNRTVQYSVDSFRLKNKPKLEFIHGDSSSGFGTSRSQPIMEEIQNRLLSLMSNEQENSIDNICSWITTNVGRGVSEPEFIKVLMTVILEVSIERYDRTWRFRLDKFQHLQALILRYIGGSINLPKLQCLITLQEYIHQLEPQHYVLLEAIEAQILESILFLDAPHPSVTNIEDTLSAARKSVAMMAVKSFISALE